MKTSAISAMLIMVLAPLVSAAPDDRERTGRISYSHLDKPEQLAPASGWVELASPTPTKFKREFVIVDPQLGPLDRLALRAARGRPVVRSVRVVFTDGTQRVVRVNRKLKKARPAYVVLGGDKRVERLVIVSDRASRGTYTVHGELAPSAVASR